jgi:hypothetical protein
MRESLAVDLDIIFNGQFPAIEFAPERALVACSLPAGDQCVASSSSHIRTQFHKLGRFDNAGRRH